MVLYDRVTSYMYEIQQDKKRSSKLSPVYLILDVVASMQRDGGSLSVFQIWYMNLEHVAIYV